MVIMEELEGENKMSYLVVGVGWNCSFNLHTDKRVSASIKVQ